MGPLTNSAGKIFYGMHFYPGVAEYADPARSEPYRIFINESTIRKMNPSFAGRPVFVEHVEEVEEKVDDLRKDADGWVVESFFNSADGKTWVKFIVVTERAERAIRNGWRLSNAYLPSGFKNGGLWNGVQYEKEVTGGEYEHLAIVKSPRYEESVILNPDQFKAYCEEKELELKKLANSNDKKETDTMKLSFFKKTKVENAPDLEGMSVTLPKSGKEKTLTQIINEADAVAVRNGLANEEDMVKVGENEMSVKELVNKYSAMCSELEGMKKKNEEVQEDVEVENEDEADKDAKEAEKGVENMDVESDKDAMKKALELAEHEEKEVLEKKSNTKETVKKDQKHFDTLKNAHKSGLETVRIELMEDQVARGKSRYGSSN